MNKNDNPIDYKIFAALKENQEYVSGECMAKEAGISRQGLWKHIKNFVDKGYKIEALQHEGYKLISSPDKLYPWEVQYGLKTKWLGRTFYYYDVLDSTQTALWDLGLTKAEEGTVVAAETQNRGRGRLNREWLSPRGGIYFSFLLRPGFLKVRQAPQIALLAGLACVRAIKKTTSLSGQLKWPNDIYVNGKKLGGILCEINAEIDRINFIAVGIGLNINTRDLPLQATSVFRLTRTKHSRTSLMRCLLGEFEDLYNCFQKEGFKTIGGQWQEHCMLWGKRIRVKVFEDSIEGEAMGLDEEGYLRLRRDNGFIERISSGDIEKVITQ
jgi:BirA family transcriptional regulator, biotin operon repressor / biotin---[acetyl-CoA-carboxylase] ligase